MTTTRITVQRAELTRNEQRAGLVAGWAVVAHDEHGSFVVDTADTRELARGCARIMRGGK